MILDNSLITGSASQATRSDSYRLENFSLIIRQLLHRLKQILRLRQDLVLQDRLIGDERVLRRDALHGSVKLVE